MYVHVHDIKSEMFLFRCIPKFNHTRRTLNKRLIFPLRCVSQRLFYIINDAGQPMQFIRIH